VIVFNLLLLIFFLLLTLLGARSAMEVFRPVFGVNGHHGMASGEAKSKVRRMEFCTREELFG
jgi:hypothetical protein